jgi:hypothetical protein
MYFYIRTSRISEKKEKTLFFGCIRHLVCLGNERRDSPPWKQSQTNEIDSGWSLEFTNAIICNHTKHSLISAIVPESVADQRNRH